MKLKLAIFILLCSRISISQVNQTPYFYSEEKPQWVQLMYTENPNYFELREAFDTYYKTHPFVKNYDTQFFKRLMKENWKYVDTNGFVQRPVENPIEEATYLALKQQQEQQKSANSQWQEIGPWQYDYEQAMAFQVQSPGSAHVYTVEQSLSNDQLVYVGTATAGVWKSINKGQSWQLVTKNIMVNSVYSVAMDPLDNNIVYFGEEDGTIWKTIDGGITWAKTGNIAFQNASKWIRDLKIIGVNTLLAATNSGLFRSIDGGVNWTSVHVGEHMEIELNPSDYQVIYTVKLSGTKTEFYKSLDNGQTWTLKTNGWPLPVSGSEQKRTEIGVSDANPNIVYVWCAGAVGQDEGFYGYYKSTDAGESFVYSCCGTGPGGVATVDKPNMLGYAEDGTENGGQYYYDLAFGASPLDENKIYGSGINVWRSENGGTNWELNAHWVTWVGDHTPYRYSHADVHDIKFFKHGSSVDMWVCSDGGVFYSSDQGDTIVPRMHGIHGTDFWGYQAGFKQGDVMLGGTYHNGTLIKYKDIYHGGLNTPNSGGWLAELGGDNYRGFVNFGNSKIGYHDNGAFEFSEIREERITSRGFDGNNICNTSYVTGEYGNYGFTPNNFNEFYSPVGTKLMKTENGGISFTTIHDFLGSKLIQVKVSWSNPNVIYVTHKPTVSATKIMKSTDYGITWVDVTPAQSTTGNNSNRSKYIEVDEKDPTKIWCILMGGQTGNKVFKSIDGGINWTNITGTAINSENVISIFHHYGSDDGIYIGTTKAVYYKNNSMTDWALFNNNLPASTSSVFLEPFYAGGKIRAASQRSVFECDFYENAPPVAMIAVDKDSLNISSDCMADTIHFVDHSTVRSNSAIWQWTFEGGSPATSNLENPDVVYTSPGNYNVKLVVTDQFGADSITLTNFITITNNYANPHIAESFDNSPFPPVGWKLYDSQGSSWEQDSPDNAVTNKCASFPNYWVDGTNQQHYLILPAISFANEINSSLSFDVCYHDNGSYTDSLAVIYRIGTNPNWQRIWVKGGADLSVNGTDVWFWYDADPSVIWRNETIDLSFLGGNECLEIAFSNIGKNGNHIWLDNINLEGGFARLDELNSNANISVFPNPSKGKYEIRTSINNEIITYQIQNTMGQIIVTGNGDKFDISNEKAGIYFVIVKTKNGSKIMKLIKE
ncbi:MAG: T9SS type A sorting domain-containing protein [Flavobacteriia bacterium]|nr:T9SS type A sorting domain-containing protein [Flavobacteriia bacterium]